MTDERSRAARELLAFYAEAGVDASVGEDAVNRLEDAVPMAPSPMAEPAAAPGHAPLRKPPADTPKPAARAAPSPSISPEETIAAARTAARQAATLGDLRAIMDAFEGCALRATASQLVFADGNPQAKVMFVGEAPGRDEDIAGLPFVGPSGKLLDRMLASIGLDRTNAYIANIIPWRPPGNRDPSTHETQICLPFIQRHIELVNPDVMVCLGKPSSIALLNITDGIRKARGRWMKYNTGAREIAALPTFHPAYLLRSPLEKRLAWRDLLAVQKALAG